MINSTLQVSSNTTFDTLFYIQRFRAGLAISTENEIPCVCAQRTGLRPCPNCF